MSLAFNPWPSINSQLKAKDVTEEDFAEWKPLPHQIPPIGNWNLWLMMGGRGAGKTDGGARWLDEHVNGPACDPRIPGGHRPAIIAPTLGDAYESCVMGPSGLKTHNPAIRTVTRKGGTYVIWPNGTEARIFGAYTPNDVERLRAGGNRCAVWCEELAAWRQLKKTWDQMKFGLRVGPHPKAIATTTPKPRKKLKELLAAARTAVTRAKMTDNPYLSDEFKNDIAETYGGTRLGRQEMNGELLEDVPGAVATMDLLDAGRRDSFPPLSERIVMVDPSQTNTETSDAAGITVQGRAGDEVYLLDDGTEKLGVNDWADKAVVMAVKWECPAIYYEAPGGSDAYGVVIQDAINRYNQLLTETHEREWGSLPRSEQPRLEQIAIKVEPVPANLSKRDRAVVLEMAIQQGRYHIVGLFPDLEGQLTTWVPGEQDEDDDTKGRDKMASPNNMDAAVHGFRVLMGYVKKQGPGRSMGSQIRNARL